MADQRADQAESVKELELSPAIKALKNLEEQLSCPVCLKRYIQPKTLPCLHSFCLGCLERLPVKDHNLISCPVCRQTIQLPTNGASGFLCSFLINSFLELHDLLKKVSGRQQSSCENCNKELATGYCKQCSKFLCQTCIDTHNKWGDFTDHSIAGVQEVLTTASMKVPLKHQPAMDCTSHGKPLEVYCDTCDQLICHLCTATKHHRDHEYEPMTDSYKKQHQVIVDGLIPVIENLAFLSRVLKGIESQEREVHEQREVMKREIHDRVQELVQVLVESERQLKADVDSVVNEYLKELSAHKNKAAELVLHLKNCEEFAKEGLRIGSQQEILAMKKSIVERMKMLCSQVEECHIQPLNETKFRFVQKDQALESCRNIGSVLQFSNFEATRRSVFFSICDCVSGISVPGLLSCKLFLTDDPTVAITCDVVQDTNGKFEASFCPSSPGLYQLKVQVGEANISSLFTVEVIPRQMERMITTVACPGGVALLKFGQLLVVENVGNCVSTVDVASENVLQRYGLKTLSRVRFFLPFGVAVMPNGRIIVADQYNHRIQVLTVDGSFVSAVGSEGSQPLQFRHPLCIAVHPSGKIFVTDCANDRVQVLNSDLTFSHFFGKTGQLPEEFNTPFGIAIDSSGSVYVADSRNSRIQKFTPEGDLVAVFDNDQLVVPAGLCIDDNDVLYVTDVLKNTVSLFSARGHFLGFIGNSDGSSFSTPQDVAVDHTGRVFVSHKNGVVVYT